MSDRLNHLGPIWYHSELSEVSYSANQYLDRDFLFTTSYSKATLVANLVLLKPSIEEYMNQVDKDLFLQCMKNAIARKTLPSSKPVHFLMKFYFYESLMTPCNCHIGVKDFMKLHLIIIILPIY